MEASLPKHLAYLSDAAHLLRVSAPETSAFVMRSRNELLFENDLQLSDAQKQSACSACGHIMFPGQGTTLNVRPNGSGAKRKRGTKSHSTSWQGDGPQKSFICSNCLQTTTITMPPPAPLDTSRKRKLRCTAPEAKLKWKATTPGTLTTAEKTIPSAGPTTANASSKKRAKSRKAGLQALLDDAQSTRGSRSLSLADFMRK